MISPKKFYNTYRADETISYLAERMMCLIRKDCVHAFEFGCGEGKHLRRLEEKGVVSFGMDISIINVFLAQAKGIGVAYGDESYLRHLVNFDCCFTVSVLDHIPDVAGIIAELKRIANKVVYLIETNDQPGEYYYPHPYEKYGFKKIHELIEVTTKESAGREYVQGSPLTFESDAINGDGATYYLYKWTKGENESLILNDDLG